MDLIYYFFTTLFIIVLLTSPFLLMLVTIKSSLVNDHLKKPSSRPRIFGAGFALFLIVTTLLGNVIYAIEPYTTKQKKLANENTKTLATSTGAVSKVSIVSEKTSIAFVSEQKEDSSLPKGETKVIQAGVNGEKETVYEVTTINNKETSRRIKSENIITQPISEVIALGTYVKPTPTCDPNYSGCVPIASDVDCSGGSGNGPAYTSGPVRVVGRDIYGLDRDGDGWGCE